jgi:hypothetical protein
MIAECARQASVPVEEVEGLGVAAEASEPRFRIAMGGRPMLIGGSGMIAAGSQ